MIDKLKILQCLIENRAFASSHSALAKSLGYKGKMVVYRLMEGQVKEATATILFVDIISSTTTTELPILLHEKIKIFIKEKIINK